MNDSDRNCPICGTENPAGKNFCSSCGEVLTTTASLASDGESSSGRRFSWPIAITLFVTLAVAGAAAGYFAGSWEETDGGGGTTSAPSTQGSAETPPKVLCREGGFRDYILSLETEPSECEVLAKGAPIDAPLASTASFRYLEWIRWDEESATAEGSYFIPSYGPRPALIQLLDPEVACGEVVFTRITAELDKSEPIASFEIGIEGCLPEKASGDGSNTESVEDEFDTGDGPVATVPPVAEGADAFIIKPGQSCPPGWEKRRSRNNQTGQVDTSCHRFGS